MANQLKTADWPIDLCISTSDKLGAWPSTARHVSAFVTLSGENAYKILSYISPSNCLILSNRDRGEISLLITLNYVRANDKNNLR